MPSRRQVLAAGTLALAGGSGCSQIRAAIADETATTTAEDASAFRVTVTTDGGEAELFTGADVATVGEVEPARNVDAYRIPVTLTDEGSEAFAVGLEDVGALDDPDSHRIRTYFEGEQLYEARLGRNLADAIERGDWDGTFLFHVSDRETAEKVRDALESR